MAKQESLAARLAREWRLAHSTTFADLPDELTLKCTASLVGRQLTPTVGHMVHFVNRFKEEEECKNPIVQVLGCRPSKTFGSDGIDQCFELKVSDGMHFAWARTSKKIAVVAVGLANNLEKKQKKIYMITHWKKYYKAHGSSPRDGTISIQALEEVVRPHFDGTCIGEPVDAITARESIIASPREYRGSSVAIPRSRDLQALAATCRRCLRLVRATQFPEVLHLPPAISESVHTFELPPDTHLSPAQVNALAHTLSDACHAIRVVSLDLRGARIEPYACNLHSLACALSVLPSLRWLSGIPLERGPWAMPCYRMEHLKCSHLKLSRPALAEGQDRLVLRPKKPHGAGLGAIEAAVLSRMNLSDLRGLDLRGNSFCGEALGYLTQLHYNTEFHATTACYPLALDLLQNDFSLDDVREDAAELWEITGNGRVMNGFPGIGQEPRWAARGGGDSQLAFLEAELAHDAIRPCPGDPSHERKRLLLWAELCTLLAARPHLKTFLEVPGDVEEALEKDEDELFDDEFWPSPQITTLCGVRAPERGLPVLELPVATPIRPSTLLFAPDAYLISGELRSLTSLDLSGHVGLTHARRASWPAEYTFEPGGVLALVHALSSSRVVHLSLAGTRLCGVYRPAGRVALSGTYSAEVLEALMQADHGPLRTLDLRRNHISRLDELRLQKKLCGPAAYGAVPFVLHLGQQTYQRDTRPRLTQLTLWQHGSNVSAE